MKNVQIISLMLVTAILAACKEESNNSSAANAQSKNEYVPGCDSTGNGIVNNPHCDNSESPTSNTWLRQFSFGNSFSSDNHARGLALDKTGSSIAVGTSYYSFDGGTPAQNHSDAFVIKYDSSGNKLWSRQFGGPGTDIAQAVEVDSSNNIYVVGSTRVDWPLVNPGRVNIFVHKYDSNGNLQWSKQYGYTRADIPNAIAIDTAGNLYIGGYTSGAFAGAADPVYWDGILMKLNSSGDLIWKKQIGLPGVPDSIYSVKLDEDNNIYVGGQRTIAKLKNNGDIVWHSSFNFEALGLAISSNGDLFVSGYSTDPINGQNILGSGDGFISKYNKFGNHLWTRTFGSMGHDRFFGLTLDSNDNPVACGYLAEGISATDGSWGGVVTKYSNSGDFIGAEAMGNSSGVHILGIATDASDRLVLMGRTGSVSLDGSTPGVQSAFLLSKSQ